MGSHDDEAAASLVPLAQPRPLAAEERAWGVNEAGRDIEITLHVVLGRLAELEIWAGWDGGEVRTDVPRAATLRTT